LSAKSPQGWSTIFQSLDGSPGLRVKVADFGVKFRLAQDLRSSAFEGDSAASDSYYVLLKVSILYSAVEALERIIGKEVVSFPDWPTASQLRETEAWRPFLNKLEQVVDSKNLKESISNLGADARHDDLRPLIQAIRHGFFHPGLTAENSTLTAQPKLRQLLLKTCDSISTMLDEIFGEWTQSLNMLGAYARSDIEAFYEKELSQIQWNALREEVERGVNAGTDSSYKAGIERVMLELEKSNALLVGGVYTKESVEGYYVLNGPLEKDLTDQEWKALVLWCQDLEEGQDLEDRLLEGIENLESIAPISELIENAWREEHGNPYPFDKDGNNTQEND
jgi:hypothetical protein